ncbi:hypothetical protein WR25_13023 isoform C [Diploscapter pachys]|uniref:PARP-type domain-containing protein n=1 Tax=Diploscapter pachys TaxID=2018661 RepID=A0A2A2JUM8_9BILA|nr:hypothetical protein WR25_13023 isoform C [Diploscapter pachys]
MPENESKTRFAVDVSKRASKCQKCKNHIDKGSLRLCKIIPNFFVAQSRGKDDDREIPDMKQYHHVNCMFEVLHKSRITTKVIDSTDDLEGWDDIDEEQQEEVLGFLKELQEHRKKLAEDQGKKKTPAKRKQKEEEEDDEDEEGEGSQKTKKEKEPKAKKAKKEKSPEPEEEEEKKEDENIEEYKDNGFKAFCSLCDEIGAADDEKKKANVIKKLINKEGYKGDLSMIFLMLLTARDEEGSQEMDEKKIIHHFSKVCEWDEAELLDKLDGEKDSAQVIIDQLDADGIEPSKLEKWSVHKVKRWLDKLKDVKEDEAVQKLLNFTIKRVTSKELFYLIRLIVGDLRIGTTEQVVLGALGEAAVKEKKKGTDLETIIAEHRPKPKKLAKKESTDDETDENRHPQKQRGKSSQKKDKAPLKNKKAKYDSDSEDEEEEESESEESEEEEESEISDLSEEDESELDSDLMKTDSDEDQDDSSEEGEDDDDDGSNNRRVQVENCKYSCIIISTPFRFSQLNQC